MNVLVNLLRSVKILVLIILPFACKETTIRYYRIYNRHNRQCFIGIFMNYSYVSSILNSKIQLQLVIVNFCSETTSSSRTSHAISCFFYRLGCSFLRCSGRLLKWRLKLCCGRKNFRRCKAKL